MFQKPPRRFRPSARPQSNTVKAVVLAAAVGAGLLAFAAYALINRTQPTDAQHCRVGAVPERSAYVLIDLTDALGAEPLQRIRGEVLRTSAALGEADRLEILVLAAPQARAPAGVLTLFAGCRPRAPAAAGLDRGRRVLERELQAAWTQPIQASLDALPRHMGVPAATSPLLATIKELALRAQGQRRSLLLASDLMEAGGGAAGSAYSVAGLEFRRLQDAGLDAVRVDGLMSGFEVRVFELIDPRHPKQQTQARQFWTRYFEAAGAKTEFSRL